MTAIKDGLTNRDALLRLREEIVNALEEYESSSVAVRQRKWKIPRILGSLSRLKFHLPYSWSSAILTSFVLFSYPLVYFSSDDARFSSLLGEWFVLFVLMMTNIFLSVWLDRRRSSEIPARCRYLEKRLLEYSRDIRWSPGDFPNLFTPMSPCIAVQWAYRDGFLVNVPWALLVAGDVILLKPGQEVPGRCVACDPTDKTELQFGEVYAPLAEDNDEGVGDQFNVPRLRNPSEPKPHRLLETPVMNCIRFALNNAAIRPPTVFERERRMIVSTIIEQALIPLLMVGSFGVNICRYTYLFEWSGEKFEMAFLIPAITALPLIPLSFPLFWVLVNLIGMARVLATFQAHISPSRIGQSWMKLKNGDVEVGEGEPMMDKKRARSPGEVGKFGFWNVLERMKFLLCSCSQKYEEYPALWLSSNLLHVLGSVTALCCIDKKGILSWPNPVADKVFFFRYDKSEEEAHLNTADVGSSAVESAPTACEPKQTSETVGAVVGPGEASLVPVPEQRNRKLSFDGHASVQAALSGDDATGNPPTPEHPVEAEVLDLYQDPTRPFHLQFDDPSISKGRHLKSLKPLGLAALLNTCNPETQNHYAHFCSYITAQAMTNEALVPVTNRRCLCELAHQIGFSETAAQGYELCDQLATFRHVEASLIQSSRLAKSLSTAASARLKFPFPHMVGVVVKEAEAGGCQLLSQGTADIVLDCCVDLWDGEDLVPLNDVLRKKILDFYHRSSLTGYCTAFAYCPMLFPLGGDVSAKYLELPPEGHQVNYAQSPTPAPLNIKPEFLAQGKHGLVRNATSHYSSNDSLSAINDFRKTGRESTKESSVAPANASAWACLMAQSQQVFLGMVTMQYQARPPLVQLVEHLEAACVRFVHFSKENELRSRVFSAKMGLESGWNCHISLLSENKPPIKREKRGSSLVDSKPHSFSAPSAMNLEVPQDDEDNCVFEAPGKTGRERYASEAVYPTEASLGDVRVFQVPASQGDAHEVRDVAKGDIGRGVSDGEGTQPPGMGNKTISASQESSHFTDSSEQTAPVPFDMSNRAKLPRGIENIRPHLNHVDNVPLLVSLFTDCTPAACEEMIRIMQDYEQVVCVFGSTASAQNTVMFLQADSALGVEPLYPQVCMKVPVTTEQETAEVVPDGPKPVDVSHLITSLPCALSFRSGQPLVIFEMIYEARNFMKNARNALQFWLCSSASVSLLILINSCCLLPPIFRPCHVLTLGSIVAPVISAGLMGNPLDPRVMSNPTGKLQTSPGVELVAYTAWFYGSKFFPTILAVLVVFMSCLRESCVVHVGSSNCTFVYPERHAISSARDGNNEHLYWSGWAHGASDEAFAQALVIAQNLAALLFCVCLGAISTCFVHRTDQLWQRSVLRNSVWCGCVIFGTFLQGIFCLLDLSNNGWPSKPSALVFPTWLICSFALLPVAVIILNEVLKRREILLSVRYLKRARLEFTTKLGMNSPF